MPPDPRKVRLVELLLAKAARTNFPEEAASFRKRARELMAKYGIPESELRPAESGPSPGWARMSRATTIRIGDRDYEVTEVTLSGSGRSDGGQRITISFFRL